MTARGTLYIDENCRDVFKQELDKVFGEDNWNLDGSDYGIWDMADFPIEAKVAVLDDDRKKIGEAVIISKPIIVDEGMGRYIDVEPIEIKITKNG
jgi:hypothetical protein